MRPRFKARPPRVGSMNRTEEAYHELLKLRHRAGEIAWMTGHGEVTLKIGPDCRYTPDFAYVTAAGEMVFAEVKGFMRDDALVKFKTAAEKFQWARFQMVRKVKAGWETLYEY